MEITKKIKMLATSKGMTINKVAQEAGLSPFTVYKWDVYSPTVDKLQKVAAVLGCTLDDLVKP